MKNKEQLKLHFLVVKHNMNEAVLIQNVSCGRDLHSLQYNYFIPVVSSDEQVCFSGDDSF